MNTGCLLRFASKVCQIFSSHFHLFLCCWPLSEHLLFQMFVEEKVFMAMYSELLFLLCLDVTELIYNTYIQGWFEVSTLWNCPSIHCPVPMSVGPFVKVYNWMPYRQPRKVRLHLIQSQSDRQIWTLLWMFLSKSTVKVLRKVFDIKGFVKEIC